MNFIDTTNQIKIFRRYTIFEMSEIRKQLAAYEKTDNEQNMLTGEELKAKILQNLSKISQKRLQEVIYNVFLYDSGKEEIDFPIFEIKELDLLLEKNKKIWRK